MCIDLGNGLVMQKKKQETTELYVKYIQVGWGESRRPRVSGQTLGPAGCCEQCTRFPRPCSHWAGDGRENSLQTLAPSPG